MHELTCRICLKSKRSLNSVFECDQYLTYSEMIFSLANIQILKSESHADLICLQCQRKLRDSYDFKVLIQRSNLEISNNYNVKRLQFDNIEDVKNILPGFKHCSKSPKFNFNQLMNNQNTFKYHETDITKINIWQELNPLVHEIGENDNDLLECYISDGSYSNEYSQPLSKRKSKLKSQKIQKSAKLNKGQSRFPTVNKVCIKPKLVSKTVRIKFFKPKKERKSRRLVEPLICPICGKLTKYLDQHIIMHTGEKKYKCDNEICMKSFYTQSQLKAHMKIHSRWKSFKCDKCSAMFSLQSSLNSHQSIHEEDRRFVCDVCNKAFKRRCTMTTHKRRHTLPMCKCEECGLAFYTPDSLRHHKRVHTGERPFRCELCSQLYSYKHDFNRHCYKKHGVFLKRRNVYIMNEETLLREKNIMRELSCQLKNGFTIKEIKNPFEGPQAVMALEMAIKMLKENNRLIQ